jgi:hypothetical protein
MSELMTFKKKKKKKLGLRPLHGTCLAQSKKKITQTKRGQCSDNRTQSIPGVLHDEHFA